MFGEVREVIKMCDTIELPDGTLINEIDGDCLCCYSQEERLKWIAPMLREIVIGERLIIERDCFGWTVTVEKK
jgi:hypothetical protein